VNLLPLLHQAHHHLHLVFFHLECEKPFFSLFCLAQNGVNYIEKINKSKALGGINCKKS
jgi:hypothetical protein